MLHEKAVRMYIILFQRVLTTYFAVSEVIDLLTDVVNVGFRFVV